MMEQSQSLADEGPAPASANTDANSYAPTAPEARSLETSPPQSPVIEPSALPVCGVCESNAPKYKCPRCYLPYCSVACNKIHKENHPPDPEPEPIAKRERPEALTSTGAVVTTNDPSNPFRALDTSEHLQYLFRKYPGLRRQLLDIHAATQPPQEAPEKKIPASMMQGVGKKDGWNHDVGIKRGKEALRKARRAEGEAGDAIREYTELVLHLINSQDDKGQAATMLQQQVAREDTRLIEQLMAQERR